MPTRRRNRWYGLEGQSDSRTRSFEKGSGTRKLVSLIVLLVLVLILIQKVSDSKQVEKVGEAVGLFEKVNGNAKQSESDSVASEAERESSHSSDAAQDDYWLFEQWQLRSTTSHQIQAQQILEYLLSLSNANEMSALAEQIFSEKELGSIATLEGWRTNALELLDGWEETLVQAARTEDVNVIVAIEGIAKLLRSSTQAFRELPDDTLGRAFRLALDHQLAIRMEDNQNWRESDHLASLRTWQRINELRQKMNVAEFLVDDVPNVEVMQLVSTSNKAVKAVPVRFRGTIVKVDERKGQIKGAGWPTVDYRVLWLKPDEANSQPVMVYCPNDLLEQANASQLNRLIEVAGFFTKKVAYASQRGPETAPVLFAAAIRDPELSIAKVSRNYSRWLGRLPAPRTWLPPLDLNKPLSLVVATVSQSMDSVKADDQSSEPKAVAESVIRMLLATSKHAPEINQLCGEDRAWPVVHSIQLVTVRGVAAGVNRVDVDKQRVLKASTGLDAMKRAEQKQFYQLEIEESNVVTRSDTSSQSVDSVYCNRLPTDWIAFDEGAFRQPFEASGFLLEARIGGTNKKVLVTDEIRWKISQTDSSIAYASLDWKPKLTPQLQYALALGWDLSFRDLLASQQSPVKPLSSIESEPLYSLLRLESERGQKLSPSIAPTASLTSLLESSLAKKSKGSTKKSMEWIVGNVRVVRLSKMPVEKQREGSWLGSDHYYELDCMADIGSVTLEMPTSGDPIIYSGEYPMTILTREIPDWLSDADAGPDSEAIAARDFNVIYPRMRIQFEGWFYRFWSYKTQEITQSLGSQHRQTAPLVVAHRLKLGGEASGTAISNTNGDNAKLQWLIGLAGVGGIWWFLRRWFRSSKNTITTQRSESRFER